MPASLRFGRLDRFCFFNLQIPLAAVYFESNRRHQTTVAEVAALMALSERTVTKMFENEKVVHIHAVPRKRKRTSYRTIRIPRHITSGSSGA